MNHKLAKLSAEQEEKLKRIESELGCVLIAYENKSQSMDTNFHYKKYANQAYFL